MKCLLRGLNVNVTEAHSHKEHVRLFWMPVYMSHLGLFTIPSLNK